MTAAVSFDDQGSMAFTLGLHAKGVSRGTHAEFGRDT